jgi:predicted acylesterase/phospholipase RssA
MKKDEFQKLLAEERQKFRAKLEAHEVAPSRLFSAFNGRIAVVLSGGGARGAYEAGALMAFQDAGMPTHIIAATSVGSINAASYASHSSTLVGNAESLVESWTQVSPPAMGIDWSRYVLMLTGLIAATAGFFNALRYWLEEHGTFLHTRHPVMIWLALMLAGISILLLHDQMPYIFYVVANLVHGGHWKPDRLKALRSALANLLVWGFVYIFLSFTHLHFASSIVRFDLSSRVLATVLVVLVVALWFMMRARLSLLSHRFLRLPLHSGLFHNYERTKFLRSRIAVDGLRASPIRVVMTATDLDAGEAKYFCNAPPDDLACDLNAQSKFVRSEVVQPDDLLQAVIASSAFTIVYQTVPMLGRSWSDGGVITNQPIRPAVRLGADVLFLVMMQPVGAPDKSTVKTFMDAGVRAMDILMARNLKADLRLLDYMNGLCANYAGNLNLRPEEIEVEMAGNRFRYIKAFTISPGQPLPAASLDFDSKVTCPTILEGYRDSQGAVLEFLDYLTNLKALRPRHLVRLVTEELREKQAAH